MNANQHTEFFNWIEEKQNILGYIEITTTIKKTHNMTFSDYRNMIHSDFLAKLKILAEEQSKNSIRLQKTLVPRPKPRHHDLSKLFHTLIFIEQTLLDFIYTQREKLLMNESTLIEMYETPELIPKDLIVKSDIEKMKKDFSETTFHILALKTKYKILYHEYMRQSQMIASLDQRQSRFDKILKLISHSYDERISFFPPTNLQKNFEHILFTPGSPWLEQLDDFILNFNNFKPNVCIRKILLITKSLCKFFTVNDEKHISIIIGLLFRTIFDEIYPIQQNFHCKSLAYDVLANLRDLTIADVDPPRDYIPKTFLDKDNAGEDFRKDPIFKEAINVLEMVSFFTNPLDILRAVHFAILQIEEAAGAYAVDRSTLSMLPFEVTFGLLVGCVLGSNIPELVMICSFVSDYAPKVGMSSDTEFAFAKLTALGMHMKSLAKNKEKTH